MPETRGTIKGALIGGVIGAAAALLLAPKSGKELRGDIRDRYSSMQDRTKQLLSEAGNRTREMAKHVGQSWKTDAKAEMKDDTEQVAQ
ncbi:YtxH domain-containing protein [Cohnella terricola]|nr:YtxH domain-containing protein [Cohnella terricola]